MIQLPLFKFWIALGPPVTKAAAGQWPGPGPGPLNMWFAEEEGWTDLQKGAAIITYTSPPVTKAKSGRTRVPPCGRKRRPGGAGTCERTAKEHKAD